MQNELTSYIFNTYGVAPEHPWAAYPEHAVFKAKETDKWFALMMWLPKKVLGLQAAPGEMIWAMNVKADPGFVQMTHGIEGIMPAYHMNKRHWITILLDGTVPMDQICDCLERSYRMVTDTPSVRIYQAVQKIPRGFVATYGQVAEMAGDKKMARAVGNALHRNPDPEHIPCYRVVNSKGELAGAFAFGGANVQADLLRADGIEVIDNKVDLKKYGIKNPSVKP